MKKRNLFIALSSIFIVLLGLLLVVYRVHLNVRWKSTLYVPEKPIARVEPKDTREPWLTVFVHGTFASPFGLLNLSKTINDEVRGTWYHKVAKKIRTNPFFYVDQIIQGRGLQKIEPTYDLRTPGVTKIAAFPLVKAYKDMLERVKPNKEHNYFYTFGWSGLLSQKVRRFESIRLYNALAKELEHFARRGIMPKIRLLCHSHGGNVILNLSLINEVLAHGINNVPAQLYVAHPNKHGALRRMHTTLASLAPYEKAIHDRGNKKWDYKPLRQHLTIDECIMYGTPIQPETEHCADRATFKKLYNFYSDEDIIQKMDWVSTKRYYSEQRFAPEYIDAMKSGDGSSRLVQARIMQERKLVPKVEKELTWWQQMWKKVTDAAAFFIRRTKDPTHKEMWFIVWDEDHKEPALSPLPTVVLSPLLKQLVDKNEDHNDIDLNITYDKKELKAVLVDHDTVDTVDELQISASFIKEMKENILMWRPGDYSAQKRFEIIEKYTTDEAQ